MTPEAVCAKPVSRGPRKGLPATGTATGYKRHLDAGEKPCRECQRYYLRDPKRPRAMGGRGVWCARGLHRITGDNVVVKVRKKEGGRVQRLCRACYNYYRKEWQRKTWPCDKCGLMFNSDEAFEKHQYRSPGNANRPPERCLDDVEKIWAGLKRIGVNTWAIDTKTHCKNGHRFSPKNTYLDKRGWRKCRKCERNRAARQQG